MLKKNILLFCLLNISMIQAHILITDVGGDPDDALAIKMALFLNKPPQAIIATHHKPKQKASIAKLLAIQSGHPNVPVYVGDGCNSQTSREEFTKKNSLWPSFFGYLNPKKDEHVWNATQARAFKDINGPEYKVAQQKVERGSAHELIISSSKKYDQNTKLDIVTLGPLHDLYNALIHIKKTEGEQAEIEFAKKIRLWSMGGTYPFGYNWLISPETTSYVLERIETICVPSTLIRDNALNVTTHEFELFAKSPVKSKLAQAMLKDWQNWLKVEKLPNDKNLADPVTLFLYLHPQYIKETKGKDVQFPCLDDNRQLKPEFKGVAYCGKGLEDKIITLKDNPQSSVKFVTQLHQPNLVRQIIVHQIAKIFYPSVSQEDFHQTVDQTDLSIEQKVNYLAGRNNK